MAKAILGVVVGYVVFFLVTFALMTGAWFAVGIDRVFQPGTFAITPLWIGLAWLASLVAGAIGGLVCAGISKSRKVVKVLAGIVFLLAIIMCIPVMMADQTPKPRRADVKMMEAMQQGQAPDLDAFDLLRSRRRRRPHRPPEVVTRQSGLIAAIGSRSLRNRSQRFSFSAFESPAAPSPALRQFSAFPGSRRIFRRRL